MGYRVTQGDPQIEFMPDKLERRMAVALKARGVTTDAQLDSTIDALTDAQVLALVRVFLKAVLEVR